MLSVVTTFVGLSAVLIGCSGGSVGGPTAPEVSANPSTVRAASVVLDPVNDFCAELDFNLNKPGDLTVTSTGAANTSLGFTVLTPLDRYVVSADSADSGSKQTTSFDSFGVGDFVLEVCDNANSGGTVDVEISQ